MSESTVGDSAAADNDGDLLIRAETVTLDLDAEPLPGHGNIVFEEGDVRVWYVQGLVRSTNACGYGSATPSVGGAPANVTVRRPRPDRP